MNRERELTHLLRDSGASVLVCHEELFPIAANVVAGTAIHTVVTTSELDYQTRGDERVLGHVRRRRHEGTEDLIDLVQACQGRTPPPAALVPEGVAVLTYTSGTTGEPKGAMNTHRNVCFAAQVYRDWIDITDHDVIMGAAPLFHITGLIGHVGLGLLTGAPLVLTYRFHPLVVRDAVVEYRPTFIIAAITAFVALANSGVGKSDLESLRKTFSGGAAIAPAVRDRIREQLGVEVHQAYGLTETTSPSHFQPLGVAAPVDGVSGALSVGVPVFDTVVRMVGDDGALVPPGQVGELETEGPQVIPGYWNKAEASAESLRGGRLRTGDVGFMNPAGWFFIVDRKKDMINAAGYKVWPREVEDVLYGHPAVREAAVVGVPDEYRGETVRAYVSLWPGHEISPEALISYCRTTMAAYKYPRTIVVLADLPKTVSGKILRRELREAGEIL